MGAVLPHNCCNPQTCQFVNSAQCASGDCCNRTTCQFLEQPIVCNQYNLSDCELPVRCVPGNEQCPSTKRMEDGESCGKKTKGICYQGNCHHTADGLCSQMWFSQSKSFMFWNNYGGENYYCDLESTREEGLKGLPCKSEDMNCGSLHCTDPLNQSIKVQTAATSGYGYVYIKDYFYLEKFGKQKKFALKAPDYNVCGSNKLCMNGKCSLQVNKVNPKRKCPENCSGAGYCAPNNECICYEENFNLINDIASCRIKTEVLNTTDVPVRTSITFNFTDNINEFTFSLEETTTSKPQIQTISPKQTVVMAVEQFTVALPVQKSDKEFFWLIVLLIAIVCFALFVFTVFKLVRKPPSTSKQIILTQPQTVVHVPKKLTPKSKLSVVNSKSDSLKRKIKSKY